MEKIKTFYERILIAKKEIGVVTKNAKNPHFKNTYADVNAIISEVEPVLLQNDLILLQPIVEGKQFTVIQDALSDARLESYLELPLGMNPQQMGSAITYFRRYTLQSLLSLRAEDDDAQTASKVVPVKPQLKEMPNDKLTEAIEAVRAGTTTLEKIKGYYKLTVEQEKAFQS
tara:strand:- start:55 stop:570 length:516 start_codon:yes stop_codon:yes gene_type:complete